MRTRMLLAIWVGRDCLEWSLMIVGGRGVRWWEGFEHFNVEIIN